MSGAVLSGAVLSASRMCSIARRPRVLRR
ncbi:hypothetical protein [Microbacterium sp. LRZ72]